MSSRVRVAIVALLALSLLVLSPLASAGKKTFVYVHDRGAVDQVFGFKLSKAGKLSKLGGSPYSGPDAGGLCGGSCQTLAWSSKRKALISGGPSGITVYKVPSNGKLKTVNGSPFGDGSTGQLGTVAIKKGKNVYVYSTEFAMDQLRAYKLKSDRTLVELDSSPLALGDGPNGLDAQEDSLLVTNENDLQMSSCRTNDDGTVTTPQQGSTGAAFANTGSLSPDGAFAYQADFDGDVRAFSIDPGTAALSPVTGSPFDTNLGDASSGMTIGEDFAFAFAFNTADTNIAVMSRSVDGSLGAATVYSTGLSRISAHCLARNDQYLLVASDLDDLLISYAVDPTTGALTEVDSEPLPDADRVNDAISLKR